MQTRLEYDWVGELRAQGNMLVTLLIASVEVM